MELLGALPAVRRLPLRAAWLLRESLVWPARRAVQLLVESLLLRAEKVWWELLSMSRIALSRRV